jgi:hypothetical protein
LRAGSLRSDGLKALPAAARICKIRKGFGGHALIPDC